MVASKKCRSSWEKKRFESSAKRIKDKNLRRLTEIADINKKKKRAQNRSLWDTTTYIFRIRQGIGNRNTLVKQITVLSISILIIDKLQRDLVKDTKIL